MAGSEKQSAALDGAHACPILPGKDFDELISFYTAFGFEPTLRMDAYLILECGPIELHFFGWADFDPKTSYAGVYIQTPDVDRVYEAFAGVDLPGAGIPRMSALADRDWGMREFHIVDLSGNLVRFGTTIA